MACRAIEGTNVQMLETLPDLETLLLHPNVTRCWLRWLGWAGHEGSASQLAALNVYLLAR